MCMVAFSSRLADGAVAGGAYAANVAGWAFQLQGNSWASSVILWSAMQARTWVVCAGMDMDASRVAVVALAELHRLLAVGGLFGRHWPDHTHTHSC
jgi:hypothetical protein